MATTAPFPTGSDIQALKDYVKGDTGMRHAESTVVLHVTHSNLKAKFAEIRFDLHMTVDSVKHKLSTMCGTSPSSMVVLLKDPDQNVLANLSEDSRMLGYYSPHNGCILQVLDLDPTSASAGGWLEDVSLVTKYVMSEESYTSRDNTYRKYKEQRLKEDPEWTLEKEICTRSGRPYVPPQKAVEDTGVEAAAAISIGSRCSVDPGDRRGVVRYVGKVTGLPAGHWVGVEYDEPLGRNDGATGATRYFRCAPNHGAFVRPDKVAMGDYPPLDDLDGLGSDDEI